MGSYINTKGAVGDLNKDRKITEGGKTSFVLQPSPIYGDDSPQIRLTSGHADIFFDIPVEPKRFLFIHIIEDME